jgi:DNA invertase Pin-like site-specific DNA recombinase
MKIGYARVSTVDQKTDSQQDALSAAGCETIVQDKASGAKPRPKLEKLLRDLRPGDVLTVTRIDRLGRSLRHLIETMQRIEAKQADFQSLTEGIDTRTAQGRLAFHLMGALAEFERALIVERTREGQQAALRRGVKLGRPPALTAAQIKQAKKLVRAGERVPSIAKSFGVDRATLYRAMNENGEYSPWQ